MNKNMLDLAFEEAENAFLHNEVPVGAVIVKDNEIISTAFNRKEINNCCIAHAEMIAIKKATEKLNNWRLDGCDIYVTLDPCPMCASAIKQSRISNVFSALDNSDKSNSDIINKIFLKDSVNPQVNIVSNIDPQRSKKILNDFFKKQRNE